MSLTAVARKEFQDSLRSKALFGLTVLFVLWGGFLAVIQWVPVLYRDSGAPTSTLALLNSMRQSTLFFVPLVGLGLGYGAIASARERGSLRLTLGLPNTRRDVFAGKFLGRTAVVAVAIAVGYAVTATIAVATYDSFALGVFVTYTLLTVGYGSVYVGLALGLSALVDSEPRALGAALGLYALFMLFWDVGLFALQGVIYGSDIPASGLPDWFEFVGLLNPSTAFAYATRAALPAYEDLTILPDSSAPYTQDWVGFLVLAAWLAIPLAVGYWRFERTTV